MYNQYVFNNKIVISIMVCLTQFQLYDVLLRKKKYILPVRVRKYYYNEESRPL